MPTFERCDESVNDMAKSLIKEFETHHPLNARGVRIDFVFARADKDEDTGKPLNDAIKKGGIKVLGLCRKIPLKDRALGRGDAEITLDGDWWEAASTADARALLDHEMHHIRVMEDNDDLGRPILKLRKHDFEFGWFNIIAQRHGLASQECQLAKSIMDKAGQLYWPGIATTEATEDQKLRQSVSRFTQIAKDAGATMTIKTGGGSVTVGQAKGVLNALNKAATGK